MKVFYCYGASRDHGRLFITDCYEQADVHARAFFCCDVVVRYIKDMPFYQGEAGFLPKCYHRPLSANPPWWRKATA